MGHAMRVGLSCPSIHPITTTTTTPIPSRPRKKSSRGPSQDGFHLSIVPPPHRRMILLHQTHPFYSVVSITSRWIVFSGPIQSTTLVMLIRPSFPFLHLITFTHSFILLVPIILPHLTSTFPPPLCLLLRSSHTNDSRNQNPLRTILVKLDNFSRAKEQNQSMIALGRPIHWAGYRRSVEYTRVCAGGVVFRSRGPQQVLGIDSGLAPYWLAAVAAILSIEHGAWRATPQAWVRRPYNHPRT